MNAFITKTRLINIYMHRWRPIYVNPLTILTTARYTPSWCYLYLLPINIWKFIACQYYCVSIVVNLFVCFFFLLFKLNSLFSWQTFLGYACTYGTLCYPRYLIYIYLHIHVVCMHWFKKKWRTGRKEGVGGQIVCRRKSEGQRP